MINKQFDVKQQPKIIKALSKILIENKDFGTRLTQFDFNSDELKPLGLMDNSNCIMVVGKTEEAINSLLAFSDKDNIKPIPNLNYDEIKGKCKYYAIFFKDCLNILLSCYGKHETETFSLITGKEFPATMENNHFKIFIAPRVDND